MIEPAQRIDGIGEYWFSRKLAEVRAVDSPAFPVINLGIGSPDLAPPPSAVEALDHTARSPRSHGYQSYRGVPRLREAIAAFSARVYGTALDPATMILPLTGSKEGILHISLAFLDPGDEVLVPDPGYPTYAAAARLAGGRAVTYRVSSTGRLLDLAALERSDLSRVKLIWLNVPHMPTGRTATDAELRAVVAFARRHEILLVNDNPYSLIGDDRPRSILAFDRDGEITLELNSLSKSHNMAGWRIGWLAGNGEYVDAVLRVRSNMDSGMFLGLQHAAAAALEEPAGWSEGLNRTYAARRLQAKALLTTLGCRIAGGDAGLFAWAEAPGFVNDVAIWLDEIFEETRVFLVPGIVFGEGGRRFVRVSLCAPEDALAAATRRIERFLRSTPAERRVAS